MENNIDFTRDEVFGLLDKLRCCGADFHTILNEFIKSKQPKEDYTILSLIDKYDTIWESYLHEGKPHFCGGNYDYIIKTKIPFTFDINSVQRNSDKETFTLGDDIWKFGKIVSFNLYHKNDFVCALFENKVELNITVLEKVKQRVPLLITLDNIEVFDEERVIFYVSMFKIRERKTKNALHLSNPKFYTKESATEYIFMNKPLFSTSDILSFGGQSDIRGDYAKVYVDEIKNIAKSKINP